MSVVNTMRKAKIQGLIAEGIFAASLNDAPSIPSDITRAEYAKLVATSPKSQILSLFEQSKDHSQLGGLEVSHIMTNTRRLDDIIDEALIILPI